MPNESVSSLTQMVQKALLVGGDILKKGFHQKQKVLYKTPISPVTQVDRHSEKAIISLIRRKYPQHSFLAEESSFLQINKSAPKSKSAYRWVIDPLDGTTNFIHGIPQSNVSIAVEKNGVVLAGGGDGSLSK